MPFHPDAIDGFRRAFSGDIITPGDDRYEEARRVWNAMIDRRPALIARPRNAADVARCVRFAVDHRLPIAVRGGAHNVAGRGTCDDGIVVDFVDMKKIVVDPVARTAVAEPGVKWLELDRATQAHGLATTGGTVGDTGIAGLTLGGGFGWLEGKLGMTVDNLLAADVVLATGEQIRADANENADLFWALRGGGGNFGIVTSFTYRLHEIGPTIIGGMVIHPFSEAKAVLTFYERFMKDAPAELVAAAVLMTAPDGNRACGIAVAWPGDIAEGERVVRPIKSFGSPILDAIGPIPYLAQQAMLEQAMPPHMLNYWKAEFLDGLSREVVDLAVDAFEDVRSPMSSMLFFPIRGAASLVPPDATAFPHRRGYHLGIYSVWNDPAQNAPNIAWVRETWSRLKPHAAGGVYVNELGEDDDDRIAAAYGANYARLARIKAKYDPNNLFCLNANILPIATT
jgi:FAD/FMN-containing dehydrogenase